jgi:hypothetical protein
MTDDPDAIGPDGTVRLRCYLRHENIHWFAAGCTDCGHQAAIGVRPAIEIMGSGEATAGSSSGGSVAADAAGGASGSPSPPTAGHRTGGRNAPPRPGS